jgi:hypothetical protein
MRMKMSYPLTLILSHQGRRKKEKVFFLLAKKLKGRV